MNNNNRKKNKQLYRDYLKKMLKNMKPLKIDINRHLRLILTLDQKIQGTKLSNKDF